LLLVSDLSRFLRLEGELAITRGDGPRRGLGGTSRPASEPRSLSKGELRLVSITTAVFFMACLLP
jgi:hypothetical protein